MTEVTELGLLLRRFRKFAALSQEELAERAGISTRSVSDIERGLSRTPQQATVRLLVDALELEEHHRAQFLSAYRGPAHTHARRSGASSLDAAADGTKSDTHRIAGLPIESSPLLGRAREEAAILHLFRFESVRLVTLTGPGGVGKTRLAMQLAGALAPDFSEVCFVPLAGLADPALVPSTLASALGLSESSSTSAEDSLLSRLSEAQFLLVLDNLEHLLSAAPLISRLLASCPALSVLTTSRSRLKLRGEHEVEVPPLALPDLRQLPQPSSLGQFPSVALFCARARAARAEFQLTEANAPVIAEICTRLDGLPLALELAAARIRTLSPQALLLRLDHRLPILTGGPADASPRHRTMQDTILWSHDLLSPAEKQLFMHLAVFAGGASLEAIEGIVSDSESVFDPLESLSGASLVGVTHIDGGAETRFAMLETIREFAWQKLREHPHDEHELRRRHTSFYLRLAIASEDALAGPEQAHWMAVMEREHANLRAALDWCESTGHIELGLRIAAPLWRFWSACGYAREGSARLHRLLERVDDTIPEDLHAVALYASGALAFLQGNFLNAREVWSRSLPLQRSVGDERRVADTLNGLGVATTNLGDFEAASKWLTDCAFLRRRLGDQRALCATLNNLGNVARYCGHHRDALAYYEDALAGYQIMGVPPGATRLNLAQIHHDLCEHERASALLHEGLDEALLLDDSANEALATATLSALAIDVGDAHRGRTLARDAAELYRELGEDSGVALAQLNEGVAAAMLGDLDAARLYVGNSLRHVRRSGERRMEVQVLLGVAYVHLQTGELEQATLRTEESYAAALEVGWLAGIADVQNRRAHIALLHGRYLDCIRFHAAATAIRESLENPLQPAYRQEYELDLRIARSEVGDESFSLAWKDGQEAGAAMVEPRLSELRAPSAVLGWATEAITLPAIAHQS